MLGLSLLNLLILLVSAAVAGPLRYENTFRKPTCFSSSGERRTGFLTVYCRGIIYPIWFVGIIRGVDVRIIYFISTTRCILQQDLVPRLRNWDFDVLSWPLVNCESSQHYDGREHYSYHCYVSISSTWYIDDSDLSFRHIGWKWIRKPRTGYQSNIANQLECGTEFCFKYTYTSKFADAAADDSDSCVYDPCCFDVLDIASGTIDFSNVFTGQFDSPCATPVVISSHHLKYSCCGICAGFLSNRSSNFSRFIAATLSEHPS
ncbi:MAG: hypothetical protein M1819_006693 [Sarea resinae]|nr:MAG: hypothetical protein M1819_006693 [Sarea resinae]